MAVSIPNLVRNQPFCDLTPHFDFAFGIKGEMSSECFRFFRNWLEGGRKPAQHPS